MHMACLRSGNHNLNNVLFENLMSDTSDCPYCTNTVETMTHYFVRLLIELYIVCASISRTDGWPVCPCISPSHNLYSAFEH